MIACGLDFGTSNSAIGIVRDGTSELAPVEGGDTLIQSAVFFDYETRGRVAFGNEAIAAYVGQTEGRLMRALKSILGSPLIDEETVLGGRKVPLRQVVEIFVRHDPDGKELHLTIRGAQARVERALARVLLGLLGLSLRRRPWWHLGSSDTLSCGNYRPVRLHQCRRLTLICQPGWRNRQTQQT